MAATAATMVRRPSSARSVTPEIVSLSWAVSEILLALDIAPAGAAEIAAYDKVVGLPRTPLSTVDVGLQGAPNFEALSALAPDLIIIQSWQEDLRPLLSRCGRVEAIDIYRETGGFYENACAAIRRIGVLTQSDDGAAKLVADTDSRLRQIANDLRGRPVPPIYVVQMIDDNNLTAFARGSLFDAMLYKMGLANAWTGAPTLMWGGSVIGIEALADKPEALVIQVEAPSLASGENFTTSPIWRALPAVQAGRMMRLPSFWGFGALPTALRFAETLRSALVSIYPDG
jgi:ferric hydroxamate transport system substrate-binding protein